MPIQLDDSKKPLVRITYLGVVQDSEVERVVEAVRGWMDEGEPFGIVVDTLASEPLTPAQRKILAGAFEEDGDRHERLLRGCAVVIGSSVMRGVLTALTWIAAPKFAMQVVGSVSDGEAWVKQRLR